MKENLLGRESLPGVFHALEWGQTINRDVLNLLIDEARKSPNSKARLCLHPDPDQLLQVTYLAFINPYNDKIHKHPHRPEIVIPLFGEAMHTTYDSADVVSKVELLNGDNPVPTTTKQGDWHALEVLSESFVMVEIGTGPFLSTSTQYLQ